MEKQDVAGDHGRTLFHTFQVDRFGVAILG